MNNTTTVKHYTFTFFTLPLSLITTRNFSDGCLPEAGREIPTELDITHGLLFPQHNSVALNALNMGMYQLTGVKELIQIQEEGLLKSEGLDSEGLGIVGCTLGLG